MEAEHTQRRDYKAQSRKGSSASPEVGGVHKPVDRKENITLREGRNPASVGVFSWEEEPVTAKGQSLRAQRTNRKVRVLQEILYTAAKKDKKRTFGKCCVCFDANNNGRGGRFGSRSDGSMNMDYTDYLDRSFVCRESFASSCVMHSRRLSVSRMRENFTYGLMRGRWNPGLGRMTLQGATAPLYS